MKDLNVEHEPVRGHSLPAGSVPPPAAGWPGGRRLRLSDLVYLAALLTVFFLAGHGLFRKVTWYLAIDQYGYLTFAGDLARGRVLHQWPPVEVLGLGKRIAQVDVRAQTYVLAGDRMYCRYTPGFPILLAAWIRAFGPDAAHYLDPTLFLALLAVQLQLTRRVLAAAAGARWLALAATLLLVLLPSLLHLWAITILRDIAAQLFALTAILLALPRLQPLGRRRAAAIGVLSGYLLGIRVDAALFAIPIGCLLLWQRRERGALAAASVLVVVGLSPLLAYNYAATGNPFLPTQAMEIERFFDDARRPDTSGRPTSVAMRGLTAAPSAAQPAAPAAAMENDSGSYGAPSPAPLSLAARPRRAARLPGPPPVHGGGFQLRNLPESLAGNTRYLRGASGNVILLVAGLGAVAALFTNRLLFVVTVPYCLSALVFYSFWTRPDPRYIAGIFILMPLLAVGGLDALLRLGAALRSRTGPLGAGLLAAGVAGGLTLLWREELGTGWTVVRAAWAEGAWQGGSALPVVSAIVAMVAIVTAGAAGLRGSRAAGWRWPAVALAVLLVVAAVARAVPGWHRHASFQRAEVELARRTIESHVEPGAIVLTTEEIGRPAENIDYYTHAHALYLRDLERWRLTVSQACGRFLVAGHGVYLLFPEGSPRGSAARAELAHLEITHVAHVAAADAPKYFVASRFGTHPLDLYRVSLSANLRKALGRD